MFFCSSDDALHSELTINEASLSSLSFVLSFLVSLFAVAVVGEDSSRPYHRLNRMMNLTMMTNDESVSPSTA